MSWKWCRSKGIQNEHTASIRCRELQSFLIEERHVLRNVIQVEEAELFPSMVYSISKSLETDINENAVYLWSLWSLKPCF